MHTQFGSSMLRTGKGDLKSTNEVTQKHDVIGLHGVPKIVGSEKLTFGFIIDQVTLVQFDL